MTQPAPGGPAVERRVYLPTLDGLRAVAVLLVMWSHVPITTQGYPGWLITAQAAIAPGYLGVDLFFVLSGFLITRILLVERDAGRPLRWFLLRRLLRIFPIYYLLLLVMSVVRPGPELPWCALYLANFWLPFQQVHTPLQHTWSLCVEEHFYLLWPLCVAFLPGAAARRVLLWLVLPGAVGAAVLACATMDPAVTPTFVQYASCFRFLSLGAGCVLAFAEAARAREGATGPFTSVRFGRGQLLALALGLLGAAYLVSQNHVYLLLPTRYTLVFDHTAVPPLLSPIWAPVLGLVASCLCSTGVLLLVVTFAGRWSPFRLLATAPLRGLGRISYGVYLYHFPVYHWLLPPAPTAWQVAQAAGTTILIATISYLAIERPLLQRAARYR